MTVETWWFDPHLSGTIPPAFTSMFCAVVEAAKFYFMRCGATFFGIEWSHLDVRFLHTKPTSWPELD